MPDFSAILFDLDGTLIDTPRLWRDAYQMVFREIGFEFTDEEFRKLYPTGNPMRAWLEHLGIDAAHEAALRTKRDAVYEDLLRKESLWHPGAQELLQSLTGKFSTGIVTGSHTSYIDALEHHTPLRSMVDVFVDVDMVERSKPHPEGLLLAASLLGVKPDTCLYIGDQPFDSEAAKGAGMECWILQTEFTPKSFTSPPDEFLRNFDPLSELIFEGNTPRIDS